MEKNKIPIWENYDRYLPELNFMMASLIGVSDREYQVRVWLNRIGEEVDWRSESALCFDDEISWFKKILRDGTIKLNSDQIKAILRVHAMWLRFVRLMLKDPDCPKDERGEEIYQLNHPYWEKICKQAQYALSLIEK